MQPILAAAEKLYIQYIKEKKHTKEALNKISMKAQKAYENYKNAFEKRRQEIVNKRVGHQHEAVKTLREYELLYGHQAQPDDNEPVQPQVIDKFKQELKEQGKLSAGGNVEQSIEALKNLEKLPIE